MPAKKTNFTNSVNPELLAKSTKPASTIAMGMKGSQASTLCWQTQVQRERAIGAKWAETYDPEARHEAEATAALQRTQARDAARHEAYVNPATNPEIHALLYKKAPPLSGGGGGVAAAEQHGGLTTECGIDQPSAEAAAAAAPPPPAAAAVVVPSTTTSRKVRRAAEEYLAARADRCTLQQRFPDGPATAAQAVGWAAAAAAQKGQSSAPPTKAAPHRRPAGAYRKPEDEEHAALLGFDYTRK